MAPQWTGLDPELEAIFNDYDPYGPELPRKKVPYGNVYEASRAGDVERLRSLLELGVNVNARDAWDSVALYYACLAGHLDAAHMLLENGAICGENTFDGDRCHYAALNLRVRKLLKAYEARPLPLSPLPASLRELFISSYPNLTYLERSFGDLGETSVAASSTRNTGAHRPLPTASGTFSGSYEAPDVTFYLAGSAMQAHRAILAARSSFFKRKFETDWRNRTEFRFSSSKLSFAALFSLSQFFYTDRLDVAVEDMEDLVRICKVCECRALQTAVEKELQHQRYASYKSVNSGADDSPKRFMLQGSSLPWQEQLHAALRRLFKLTVKNSAGEPNRERGQQQLEVVKGGGQSTGDLAAGNKNVKDSNGGSQIRKIWYPLEDPQRTRAGYELLQNGDSPESPPSNVCSVSPKPENFEEDHADVLFQVAGEYFRCHMAILAARSEYFKARFFRAVESESEGQSRNGSIRSGSVLPVLEEHDLSAGAFKKLLEYIYTDIVEEIDPDEAEEMFDAASRYLLFPLKRAVVDVLLPHLETTSPAELCRWLLMSDMYEVSKLREHCLDAMALNFELFAATPEFCLMLASLPPPSGDDATRTSAPSAPGAVGSDNVGNILDDLREKWLAIEGEELDQRDASAREFDQRLQKLVEMAATLEESERDFQPESIDGSD